MNTKIIFILLIMTTLSQLSAQNFNKQLYDTYDTYREKSITKRRFGYTTLVSLLQKIKENPQFEVNVVEKSTEGRDIYLAKIGHGSTKVMLWSQMHGDEATATMALMDIFNFFQSKDSQFDNMRKELLSQCTFYFVPMLNPDGAEAWTRYTALGIDMNRDAIALQTPEGRLLKKLIMELKPTFGFNLHDQGRRYSAGATGNLATISFLATAYNEAQEVNDVRKKAMQLIVQLNRGLQNYIPNSVGKWPADFEPRAFGDNIQKWGTSLVLIESGGYKNDPEKQYIRQLNYVTILAAFESIAHKSYKNESIAEYDLLPVNSKTIFDLIVRNVVLKKGNTSYKVDLAINRNEKPVQGRDYFTNSSEIEEIGDMSVFFGTDEIDATGLELVAEKGISLGMKADFTLLKNGVTLYTIKNGVIIGKE